MRYCASYIYILYRHTHTVYFFVQQHHFLARPFFPFIAGHFRAICQFFSRPSLFRFSSRPFFINKKPFVYIYSTHEFLSVYRCVYSFYTVALVYYVSGFIFYNKKCIKITQNIMNYPLLYFHQNGNRTNIYSKLTHVWSRVSRTVKYFIQHENWVQLIWQLIIWNGSVRDTFRCVRARIYSRPFTCGCQWSIATLWKEASLRVVCVHVYVYPAALSQFVTTWK